MVKNRLSLSVPADTVLAMAASSPLERVPALNRRRFVCPHSGCAAFAQQAWADLIYEINEHIDFEEPLYVPLEPHPPEGHPKPAIWQGARCGSCDQWSLWRNGEMVFPQPRLGIPAHEEMPPQVRELYDEALAVAGVSRRRASAKSCGGRAVTGKTHQAGQGRAWPLG